MSITRPVIAVLMDYVAGGSEGAFSSRPHYALRQGYFEAIQTAGGTPVAVPYLADSQDAYLDMAHGVVLPGGFYPFPASYYGEQPDAGETIHPRAAFEAGFTRQILARDIPVLGICAGMQALAAASGVQLYRDVHTVHDTTIDHLNEKPAEEYAHTVAVVPGTLLHRITGLDKIPVNTAHREGIVDIAGASTETSVEPSGGVVINARAPDSVVEGLELPGQRFALGVQWHPEFFIEPGNPHLALFEALVENATTTTAKKEQIA